MTTRHRYRPGEIPVTALIDGTTLNTCKGEGGGEGQSAAQRGYKMVKPSNGPAAIDHSSGLMGVQGWPHIRNLLSKL